MRNILYNNYLVDQDQLSLRNNGCNISYKHNYEHKAKSTYSEHPTSFMNDAISVKCLMSIIYSHPFSLKFLYAT